jgi:two-component system, chemotaxis family, sensor kinase Cph1
MPMDDPNATSSGRRRVTRANEIARLSARVKALEREKAALEAFAAVAAHELLEPLILAESYAMLLNEELGDETHVNARRDLDILARSARRGRLLVETLLYARTSHFEIARRPVNLNAVVRDCLELLGPEIAACQANVRVDDLPEVLGDEAMIAGVYKNLLLNALKYSPRTGGSIHIGYNRNLGEPEFFVESEGPPIPPGDRRRIFEPFNRGLGERRARGAGLGLAICRDIVQRHGGTIDVAPTKPSGNRFFFTLPRPADVASQAASGTGATGTLDAAPGSSKL